MGSVQLHSNWAEIDLSAISDNIRFFCAHTDARVMAVVKANAYGHGAVPVAQTALKAGASWCGVAQAEEALDSGGEPHQQGLGDGRRECCRDRDQGRPVTNCRARGAEKRRLGALRDQGSGHR